MTLYDVEFSYNLPETGVIELELNDELSKEEKEVQALTLIKEVYDDISNVTVTSIKEV